MREKLLSLLDEQGMLPPLPDIVLRLKSMVGSETGVKKISSVIEIDPVLVGRILKLANSAFYSRSTTPVKTLPVAITKIGLNMLVKIVYSFKMTSLFSDTSVLDSTKFWRHSLAVALFTQSLGRRLMRPQEEQDLMYIAGLMHDIGVMVFGYLVAPEYTAFLKDGGDINTYLHDMEKRQFDIDHAELGALYIDRWWEVDKRISLAVRHHHTTAEMDSSLDIHEKLMKLSNEVCNHEGITNGTMFMPETFEENVWDDLGITPQVRERLFEDVQASIGQAEEMIGMLS